MTSSNQQESEPGLERLAARVDQLKRRMLHNGVLGKTPGEITARFLPGDQRVVRIALDSMLGDGGRFRLDPQGRVIDA